MGQQGLTNTKLKFYRVLGTVGLPNFDTDKHKGIFVEVVDGNGTSKLYFGGNSAWQLLTSMNSGAITITTSSVSNGTTTFSKYVHPTTSGNNHIPAGGSTGQILKYSADGTAAWADEYSYTHPTPSGLGGAKTTESLYKTTIDANGHITKATAVSIDTTVTASSANLITSGAVKTAIDTAIAGASNYLGTVTALTGLSTTAKKGDFYRVSTAWTGVHVGDIIIAEKNTPSQTVDGTNWSLLHNEINTDESTTYAGHYTPVVIDSVSKNAANATGTSGETVQVVTGVTIDGKGHVTDITSGAATDTLNTAGATNIQDATVKDYLIISPSQTDSARTYTDGTVYVQNHKLYVNNDKVFTEWEVVTDWDNI